MQPTVNLLLLPYAGGTGTSLRAFAAGLPSWIRPIPVTLPGRGARFREPAVLTWESLIALLADELEDAAASPYAVFGHSLGALVALELAHRFRIRGLGDPIWLGVSACIAPGQRPCGQDWLGCPEDVFVGKLRSLGGTPEELLESRELLDLFLPALRADFHLAASYRATVRPPLSSRLLVMAGQADTEVVIPPSNLAGWTGEVSGPSRVRLHAGGHFFINAHAAEVARSCGDDIAQALLLDEMAHG